jgi:hypothetical protein
LIRWRPDRRYWRLRRRAYEHVVAILQLALPTAQHCWHNPELSCHFGLHATAGLPQRYCLALKLIREPTLCRTRHHTPPGSAEPIIGVRQIEGRSIQPDAEQLLTKDRLKEIYALTGAALHAGHLKGWDKGIKRYDAGLLVKAFNDLEVHLSTHRTHLLHTNQDILVMLRKPGDGSTLTLLADRLKPLK